MPRTDFEAHMEEFKRHLPFHTWKLVPDDAYDFSTELTDEELYELTVITNIYEKVKMLPETGTVWDFASGRQAVLTIHEDAQHEGTDQPDNGRSTGIALEAQPTGTTA